MRAPARRGRCGAGQGCTGLLRRPPSASSPTSVYRAGCRCQALSPGVYLPRSHLIPQKALQSSHYHSLSRMGKLRRQGARRSWSWQVMGLRSPPAWLDSGNPAASFISSGPEAPKDTGAWPRVSRLGDLIAHWSCLLGLIPRQMVF